jgi:hypothetical protein
VSSLSKIVALFLVAMILSPVTAPFASFPLLDLVTRNADTHAPLVVTPINTSVSASPGGGVLVEEQMKDGEVAFDVLLTSGDFFEDLDGVLLVYVWPGTIRPNQQVVLRV